MKSFKFLTLTAITLAASPALASSSAWHEGEGGRVRLVTSGQPDSAGNVKGILEIELKPGWKTYWRDPGESGVPPQLDVSASTNVSDALLSFPAPQRHDDGYGQWAGYDHSVSLPIVFALPSPSARTMIDARVFLGMCETICIPVQATLTLDPGSEPENASDATLVESGFAALPGTPQAGFEAKLLPGDQGTLKVQVAAPGDPTAVDFFVAGADKYMFGVPKRVEDNGTVTFNVPILERPATTPVGSSLHYTLTSSAGSVQGLLPYP